MAWFGYERVHMSNFAAACWDGSFKQQLNLTSLSCFHAHDHPFHNLYFAKHTYVHENIL